MFWIAGRRLECAKREVEFWPGRFSGEQEETEEDNLARWACPCGCGSYSRGGRYLRGHEKLHREKLTKHKTMEKRRNERPVLTWCHACAASTYHSAKGCQTCQEVKHANTASKQHTTIDV